MYIVGRWDYAEGGTGAIWRVRRDGSSAQEVVPAPSGGGWLSPSLSPDGSSLAYVGTDGTLFIRTLANGTTRTISGLSASSVVWSPNADRLLIAGRAGLFVVGADGSGRRQLRPGIVWGRDAAWSPDGDWVVWNSGGGIELVRLEPELALTLPFSYGSVVSGGWGLRGPLSRECGALEPELDVSPARAGATEWVIAATARPRLPCRGPAPPRRRALSHAWQAAHYRTCPYATTSCVRAQRWPSRA